jgi:hypothetical protein
MDLRGINIEFGSSHQSSRATLLNNDIEEPPQHLEPIAVADAREAGVIGEGLVQVIAEVPADAEAIGGMG